MQTPHYFVLGLKDEASLPTVLHRGEDRVAADAVFKKHLTDTAFKTVELVTVTGCFSQATGKKKEKPAPEPAPAS